LSEEEAKEIRDKNEEIRKEREIKVEPIAERFS